jgi:pimeloyl-ACP methyl ester carboxylesterase
MPRVTVNGTELHHEVRGAGPPVLLIMGATGDGGHFDATADLLAGEFTVISYDRRGNGRSPAPAGWTTTSPEEQADDAGALLEALGVEHAAVLGTSSGGNFALCLLARRPELVRGALLHEPGLYALLDDPDAVRAPVRALVAAAMASGGPSAAVERFWDYMTGDDGWARLPPGLRARLRATAGTLFEVELGTYERWLPADAALTGIGARVRLLVGTDSPPFFAEIADRLGERIGVEVATTPGGHAVYHDDPHGFAEAVAQPLREIGEAGA